MNEEWKESLKSVIREELAPIHQRLGGMDARLDGMDARLGGMEVRLGGMDSRLDRLESEQQLIKQAVLETNESVKRLESIQESQHRIIELLSVRSIEQEAQLKRIK